MSRVKFMCNISMPNTCQGVVATLCLPQRQPSHFCTVATTDMVARAATSSVLRRPCHVPCVTRDLPHRARKPEPRLPSHTRRRAPQCAMRMMHFPNGTSFFSKLYVLTRIVYKIVVLSLQLLVTWFSVAMATSGDPYEQNLHGKQTRQ
jgi:hypothetical protein